MAASRGAATAGRAVGLVLAAVAALALAGHAAHADGVAFFQSRDSASMRPLIEREQRAAIVCRDGVERLVIAINIDLGPTDEALWIFPVPGTPDAVTVDLVDSFPAFAGTDPLEEAREAVFTFGLVARMTQLWVPLIEGLLMPAGGSAYGAAEVHTSVDRWGLHAETVTAESIEALAQYLGSKGHTFAATELAPFEPYMSGGYVLVVASIASAEQLEAEFARADRPSDELPSRWPCLYVEFPSERPFYPMRPTSVYGRELIPLTIVVAGSVRPSRDEDAQFYPNTSHWWATGRPDTGPARFLQALPAGRFPYTRCATCPPAEMFTADLWFEPAPEPADSMYGRIVVALFFRWPAVLTYLVAIAALSYVAGGLTGLYIFGAWKPYARLGLWNVLTLVAVAVAAHRVRDWHSESMPPKRGEGFRPGDFAFIFSATFVALTIALCQLLKLPLP